MGCKGPSTASLKAYEGSLIHFLSTLCAGFGNGQLVIEGCIEAYQRQGKLSQPIRADRACWNSTSTASLETFERTYICSRKTVWAQDGDGQLRIECHIKPNQPQDKLYCPFRAVRACWNSPSTASLETFEEYYIYLR